MHIRSLILAVMLCMSPAACAEQPRAPGERNGPVVKLLDITAPAITEMSGLVKSRRFDDVYWIHNDSGDSSRLFPVDHEGHPVFPDYLHRYYYGESAEPDKKVWPGLAIELATNIDWEDIAVDDDFVYIADMGNNANVRRDLGVYVVPEPNPREIDRTRALRFIAVRYPDQHAFPARQWHYDCEAIFVFDGKLYFLTKHRQPGKIDAWEKGTVLYRLDSTEAGVVNTLTRVDDNPVAYLVTGADTSPDGEWLAVLCYTELWLFPKPARGDKWLSGKARRIPLSFAFTGQAEAVAWKDNETIILGNEKNEWFTVSAKDIPEYQLVK